MLGEEGEHGNEQDRPRGIVGEGPPHDRVAGEGLGEHPGDEIAIVGCRRAGSAHPTASPILVGGNDGGLRDRTHDPLDHLGRVTGTTTSVKSPSLETVTRTTSRQPASAS